MRLGIQVVDAFADRPFTGNPAGVCVLDAPLEDDLMQAIAAEMNHAETAFLWPEGDAWRLRWFTPTVEVDLCGHATLAATKVLAETNRLGDGERVTFRTRSGDLFAWREGERGRLDFPAEPPVAQALPHVPAFLGTPLWTGLNRMDWFVQLADADAVRSLRPDIEAVRRLGRRGLIVTAEGGEADFVSRFFAPQSGVDEDAVTGSAHCALAPFWAERLGRSELTGYQASARGGTVGLELKGDRVHLLGRAVIVLEGSLQL